MDMPKVVGVRFRTVGKIYHFEAGDLALAARDAVVVDTVRGAELGTVVIPPFEAPGGQGGQPLRRVLRQATPQDLERKERNRQKEQEALAVAKEKVKSRNLAMRMVGAEYSFDRQKLTLYFTAENRVDFRELVRELAGVFHARIELRQVGVRDEARILGGLGPCGRELCCATFLTEFAPVSIRMAKGQNLSLNPAKISGLCGRLMCCLRYEAEETTKGRVAAASQVEGADDGNQGKD